MQCPYPDCGSDRYTKNGYSGYVRTDGSSNRKQRYKCSECGRNYSLPYVSEGVYMSWGHPEDTRQQALELYFHSRKSRKKKLSYRKIAERVSQKLPEGARKVSHGTVRNWVLLSKQEGVASVGKLLAKKKPASYTEDDAGYIT
jgi:transposase-like protein